MNDDGNAVDHTAETVTAKELNDRLSERIAARRADGSYPADIDDQLEKHFRRVVFHRRADRSQAMAAVSSRVKSAHDHSEFTPPHYTTESSVPGGDRLRRGVINVVEPTSLRLYEELQAFAIAVRESLHEIELALQNAHTHTHSDVLGHLDAALERIDRIERSMGADVSESSRSTES